MDTKTAIQMLDTLDKASAVLDKAAFALSRTVNDAVNDAVNDNSDDNTDNHKLKCIIMRGLPGSGKSTLADEIAVKFIAKYTGDHHRIAAVLSTDGYFTDDDGNYNFDLKKIGAAHQWNQENAYAEMHEYKTPLVIIDNTNTTAKEMRPYVMIARAAGYEVEICEVGSGLTARDLMRRNVHGVPIFTIINMRKRYEHINDIDDIC